MAEHSVCRSGQVRFRERRHTESQAESGLSLAKGRSTWSMWQCHPLPCCWSQRPQEKAGLRLTRRPCRGPGAEPSLLPSGQTWIQLLTDCPPGGWTKAEQVQGDPGPGHGTQAWSQPCSWDTKGGHASLILPMRPLWWLSTGANSLRNQSPMKGTS